MDDPNERPTSIIVVDGTNLDHRLSDAMASRRIEMRDIDFAAMFAKLSEGTHLLKVHYCSAPYLSSSDPRRNEGRARQTRTFNRLESLGYVELHNKGRHVQRPDTCFHCRRPIKVTVEKGTDVSAGVHLVHAACMKLADRIILVANDNDFVPALRLSNQVGARLTLAYVVANNGDHRLVGEMRREVAQTIHITPEFMDPFWIARPTQAEKASSGRS
jgi:uncharacterized LabA/DUF88 family protein